MSARALHRKVFAERVREQRRLLGMYIGNTYESSMSLLLLNLEGARYEM